MAKVSGDIIKRHVQEKAERRRVTKLYFLLFFITFIFVGLVLLAHYDHLLVKKITIIGNQVVSSDEVFTLAQEQLTGNYFYLLPKSNIFLLPKRALKEQVIRVMPYVGDLESEVFDSGVLSLKITERKPTALWCDNADQCSFMDDTGFVFSSAPKFSDNVYLKLSDQVGESQIGRRPIDGAKFKVIFLTAETLPTVLRESGLEKAEVIKTIITFDKDYEFIVTQPLLNEKLEWTLRLPPNSENFSHLLSNLKAALTAPEFKKDYTALAGRLDYIDLRFGNKVFYKFR